jgi:hydrogenase-1 operon protein HyaF
MHAFPIPVIALGPGSHHEDDALEYLALPSDMRTYTRPALSRLENAKDYAGAHALLARVLAGVTAWRPGQAPFRLDLTYVPAADRALVHQMLGEGEVSAQVTQANGTLYIQESVFAGVWTLRERTPDGEIRAERVEVGDVPNGVRQAGRMGLEAPVPAAPTPGVVNAPALLSEIAEQAARPPGGSHVINLSLLPFPPEDAAWLDERLGRGKVTMLSRGYGNCRITATGVARVWWVQFFNSQDMLILNTIEVTDVPEVARAAAEDLQDSAQRLAEVIAWMG